MTEPMNDILNALDAGREKWRNEPPIGTEENPYVVVVPGWYEDACLAQGTTPQEVADRTLRYPTRVDVLR